MNHSRLFSILTAVLLIPIFVGIYCPCAKAASAEKLVIEQAPCHGCCATMKLEAVDCQAISNAQLALRAPEISSKHFSSQANVFGAVTPILRSRAEFEKSLLHASPHASSGSPLYLLNLVLRV